MGEDFEKNLCIGLIYKQKQNSLKIAEIINYILFFIEFLFYEMYIF